MFNFTVNRAKIIGNEIAKSIATNKNYSAMEFECGTDLISFNLYDRFEKVTLIDSSKGMIDILNSNILNYKINNMVAKHLDITNENPIDEKFDVIYNSMVLHHIQDTKSIIDDFYQLLNDEGYLCIVYLNEEDGSFHKEYPDFDGHNAFNEEELKRTLVSAGFDDIIKYIFL